MHLEYLAQTTLVLLARERNAAFHDAILAAARHAGVAPAGIVTSAAGIEHALLTVAAGHGVGLLPASAAARQSMPGVRFEELATPLPACPIVVATRRHDASTTTAAFLRAVRAAARGPHAAQPAVSRLGAHSARAGAWPRGDRYRVAGPAPRRLTELLRDGRGTRITALRGLGRRRPC